MKRILLILVPLAAIAVLLRLTRQTESRSRSRRFDPLLALRGSGRDLWADEHADEFVRRLREGWD